MGRFWSWGSRSVAPGIVVIGRSVGPMAQDTATLVAVLKFLWAYTRPVIVLDPYVVPFPFRKDIFESTQPLTIGYYEDDGFFKAVPACRRAVNEAKQILEKAGHKLIPWSPPDVATAFRLLLAGCNLDGGIDLL